MKVFKFGEDFLRAAAIRCIRTGAQTAASLITVGVGVFDVDWKMVLGITATSMIASLLTSLATDLPETKIDGFINAAETPIEGFEAGDTVRFKLTDGGEG